MLSQLTKENVFMEQNRKKLNKEKIFDMLSNDKCETSVAVHFLIMIKSIMKYNIEHPLQIPKEKEEEEVDEDTVNENECDLLLNVIWKKYESEITVIKVIIDIFAVKIDNEKYIMTLMKSQLIESLCKVLILGNLDKQKKNSDGFLSVISLLNQLCKYEPCVAIIAEISIFPILTALKENIFNTKIVEGSLSLFVSVSSDDKYINKVCINEMKETTIQIINKYLNTCHTQIIVLSLKLILSFIKENKNLFFAGQITGVEGYMESASSGLIAGINASLRLLGKETVTLPPETMIGALSRYISDETVTKFQPMGANLGVLPGLLNRPRDKKERAKAYSDRAFSALENFINARGL